MNGWRDEHIFRWCLLANVLQVDLFHYYSIIKSEGDLSINERKRVERGDRVESGCKIHALNLSITALGKVDWGSMS